MDDREYWTKQLREAERELDAATRRSDVNAAAKRLQLVKAELKRLEAEAAEASALDPNLAIDRRDDRPPALVAFLGAHCGAVRQRAAAKEAAPVNVPGAGKF
jgi:hypothetical protein